MKFRIADTIYAGATGLRASLFQRTARNSYTHDVLTNPSTA